MPLMKKVVFFSWLAMTVLCGGVAFWLLQPAEEIVKPEPLSQPSYVVSLTPSAPRTVDPAQAEPVPSADVGGPVHAALWGEMEQARDWRVVFERLLANPDERSGVYAMRIVFLCARFRGLGPDDFGPSLSTRQDEARQLMTERCASFSVPELSSARIDELDRDPRIHRYFRKLSLRMGSGLDGRHARNLIAEVMATGDPMLLDSLGERMFLRVTDPHLQLEGTPLTQPYAPLVARHAWQAAVCRLAGQGCGSQDMGVLDACARGVCVDSREALLERQVEELDGAGGLLGLYHRLVPVFEGIIRNQNVDALLRMEARPS